MVWNSKQHYLPIFFGEGRVIRYLTMEDNIAFWRVGWTFVMASFFGFAIFLAQLPFENDGSLKPYIYIALSVAVPVLFLVSGFLCVQQKKAGAVLAILVLVLVVGTWLYTLYREWSLSAQILPAFFVDRNVALVTLGRVSWQLFLGWILVRSIYLLVKKTPSLALGHDFF